MARNEVAYLGPKGTYSYLVATKRFRSEKPLWRGYESVREVCDHVARTKGCRGIIPITNSSGGDIYPTVDALLDNKLDLSIKEELCLNVSLALVGHRTREISRVYSHFAPYAHCKTWLEKKYPGHEYIEAPSTCVAIRESAQDASSVAIGSKQAARIYGMEVLKHPMTPKRTKNVTHFFIIQKDSAPHPRAKRTSLAVKLRNKPGSLHDFLHPFREANVNLSRIISRPIQGKPKEVAFFIDVDANLVAQPLHWILKQASKHTSTLRVIGAYAFRAEYSS